MPTSTLRLSDCELHEDVELVAIDLPADQAAALLERGIVPGCRLARVRRSPFGDPVVRVDGTLLAMRRETAARLTVRRTRIAAD